VGSVSTHIATASVPGQWLVSMGVATWTTAIVILAVAVFPRVGTAQNTGAATYFGDVRRTCDLSRLRRYIEKAANDRLSWLLVQVSDTSRIVVTKYQYIRIALCLLALGGGLTGVGLAV
ncbi:MAG: Pycsar system effector family protein, partial [Pseudonocardiaceae bacterium]